jgi:hypothetical protein
VASPDEQTGKAAHLVSWQGQMAEVRLDNEPEGVQTVPRDWVCNRRSGESAPTSAKGADCDDPFDGLKRAIPIVMERLQKEIDNANKDVCDRESELRTARRHRKKITEKRRYEISRLKTALKVLARPRQTAQSRKRANRPAL